MKHKTTITKYEWNSSIQEKMVKFTVPIWQIRNKDITEERLENWFNNLKLEIPPIAIIAKEGNKLLGWVFLVFHNSSEAEINPWVLNGHPIVSLGKQSASSISKELVYEAIKIAEKRGISRVSIQFRIEEEKIEQYDFYELIGLRFIELNCHMRQNLLDEKLIFKGFPERYELSTINEVNQNDLFECFYESFRNSEDSWLNDKTDKEMKDYFETEILKNQFPLIEQASIALLQNNKVIAFAFVHKSHGEKNGQLWLMGVHPLHRNQGLGKAIISHIKITLQKLGFRSTSLNVDISNEPAYNLYLKNGYIKDWTLISFAWTKEV